MSKAAEFSPNRGRKKITSSGDGKCLAFLYDEAQGQIHVGQLSRDADRRRGDSDQRPASAGGLRTLHVPDLDHCHDRACGAGYDLVGCLAGELSTLTLAFFLGKFNRKEGVFMDDRTPPNRPRLSLPILGLAIALGVGLGVAIAVALHNSGVGTAIGTTIFVVGIAISLAKRGR